MKRFSAIVRALAVLMAVIMIASLSACVSSYNSNPVVAKVGNVKLDLNQYLTLYNNTDTNTNMYYTYLQYGMITREQYANYMLEELVNYGVQLDQVQVQNITLDADEEAKLQQDVDDRIKEYVAETYASKIDQTITDETAKYEAEMEMFYKELKDAKTTFEKYRANLEESMRSTALLEKLQKIHTADVKAKTEDVAKYFEDNANTSITVSSFKSAFDNFMTKKSDTAPFYMPHPERAVEDDPDTTDKDETKEADPFGEFFSVLHTLLMFKESAGDSVEDLAAYAAEDEEFVAKMEEFEASLETLTREQFIEKCFDKEVCEDPGMQQAAYQYFGYIMQEELLDAYYPGFGYACMKLKFGDEWVPEKEDQNVDASKPIVPDYEVKMFQLADGTQIAKVFTKGGAHYIILNENDIFGMYDDEGYLMIPAYDDEGNLVPKDGAFESLTGTMTQEQIDAVNEILSHVAAEVTEEAKEGDTDTEEEPEPVTLKNFFDYCHDAKQSALENEAYTAKFNEWKENTKIVTHKNLLKTFYQG
jgi:hypothetical protein